MFLLFLLIGHILFTSSINDTITSSNADEEQVLQKTTEKELFDQDISKQFGFTKDMLKQELEQGDNFSDNVYQLHEKWSNEGTKHRNIGKGNIARFAISYNFTVTYDDNREPITRNIIIECPDIFVSKVYPFIKKRNKNHKNSEKKSEENYQQYKYLKDCVPVSWQNNPERYSTRSALQNWRCANLLNKSIAGISPVVISNNLLDNWIKQLQKIRKPATGLPQTTEFSALFDDINHATNGQELNTKLLSSYGNFVDSLKQHHITLEELEDLVFNLFQSGKINDPHIAIPEIQKNKYYTGRLLNKNVVEFKDIFHISTDINMDTPFIQALAKDIKEHKKYKEKMVNGRKKGEVIPFVFSDSEQSILAYLFGQKGEEFLKEKIADAIKDTMQSLDSAASIKLNNSILHLYTYYDMCIRCRTLYFFQQNNIANQLKKTFLAVDLQNNKIQKCISNDFSNLILISSYERAYDIVNMPNTDGNNLYLITTRDSGKENIFTKIINGLGG